MNVNIFEIEKIVEKFTLNLLQINEPQRCYGKYLPQRPRITRILTANYPTSSSVHAFEAASTVIFT